MDDLPRISVPELILSCHPLGRGSAVWVKAVVPDSVGLPGNITKFDSVDCCMKVVVVGDRWGVVVGDQCGTPDIKETIDDTVREWCLVV